MQFSTPITTLALGLLQFRYIAALPNAAADIHRLQARDEHTACACQIATNGSISESATASVAGSSNGLWVLDNFVTMAAQNGAKFTGVYARGVGGSRVDGKAFFNACRRNDAGDSTCF